MNDQLGNKHNFEHTIWLKEKVQHQEREGQPLGFRLHQTYTEARVKARPTTCTTRTHTHTHSFMEPLCAQRREVKYEQKLSYDRGVRGYAT